MTETVDAVVVPQGRRVRAGDRYGQLNGYNPRTRLVTLWDESANEQVVFTLAEGLPAPEYAPLTCRGCGREASRLFEDALAPDGAEVEADLCTTCSAKSAKAVNRVTRCDVCDRPHAWRNPYTRRNEYLCSVHHAESGDGVIQNRWARVSDALGVRERERCLYESSGDCVGEIKPRGREAAVLCNHHAGRTSAAEGLADRVW